MVLYLTGDPSPSGPVNQGSTVSTFLEMLTTKGVPNFSFLAYLLPFLSPTSYLGLERRGHYFLTQ